jgi:PRTRC genetic system ThiF family protein
MLLLIQLIIEERNFKMTVLNSLPKIFSLENYQKVENILLIGCGGTGGHIAPHLCRYVNVINQSRSSTDKNGNRNDIRLFFADGDIVEQKNLLRQHFINPDISKNKAAVLAERYAAAFGIQITVIPKDMEEIKDFNVLNDAHRHSNRSDLIIGCVDNNASRRLIYDWFIGKTEDDDYDGFSWRGHFWIDAGNEENAGQVVCGYAPPSRGTINSDKVKVDKTSDSTTGEFSLPSVIEMYPELLNDEGGFNSELSCADRAASAPQNMQTNVTAATLSMNFIQKIINGTSVKSHAVEFSINNVFTTKLNTPDNITKVNKERRRFWEK